MKQYKKRKYRSGARHAGHMDHTEQKDPAKERQTSTYDGYYGYEEHTEQGAQQRPSCESLEQKPPRKKKKRRKKRYLLKFFIFVAVCVGLRYFLYSSVFDLEKVVVSGGERFTAEQLQDMMNLKKGTNLFEEFRAGDCEERLLESPYIKDVHIKRKLPSTVEIKLTERREKAVFVQDKQYIVIDSEGIVLRTSDKDPKQPVLAGITVTKAEENQPVEVKEKYGLKKAMKLLAAMEEADLYFKKIDVSKLIVRMYVTDKLYCKGEAKNLLIGMEEGDLKAVIYDLYKKKTKKGVINVGDEQYYSFSKKVK